MPGRSYIVWPQGGGYLAPSITTASLPNATVGSPYSFAMSAVNGLPPYAWSILSDIPDTGGWLSISSSGVLSGTPTTAETESLVIQLMDATGAAVSAPYSLTVSSGGLFTPQSGFSYSATTIADGVAFTITSATGVWGTKPIHPKPLLVMDPANYGLSPSPLGRTTAINNVANLSLVSTGGPAGGPYIQGAPVVSADTGTQKTWTAAVDIDQWGAGTPVLNAYGAKHRLWRTKWQNYARGDEQTQNFNIKIDRWWGRRPPNVVGSAQGYPDLYMSISNCELTPEYCSNAPNPAVFPREGQGPGTSDQDAIDNCTAFYGGVYGGTPNPVTNSNWFSERFIVQVNQNDPGSTPPTPDSTSMLYKWMVEGLNSNNPAFPTPVYSYQWCQWYVQSSVSASLSTAQQGVTSDGNMYRRFFWHDIVDSTSGRSMFPVGSYPGYGPTIFDDSWCAVEIRNNSSASAFTINEQQPTSAWPQTATPGAPISITITLRQGRLGTYHGMALIVTDNNGVEYYVGSFT